MASDDHSMNMDSASFVQGARTLGGLVTPTPIAYGLDVALAPVQGSYEAQQEQKALSKQLGGLNLEREQHHSVGIKKRLENLKNRWSSRLGEALVSVAGGATGMWIGSIIGTAVLPIFGSIIGGVVGSLIGGWLANTAYNAVFPPQNEDTVQLITQLRSAQVQQQQISPEMVFAALAAGVPGKEGKRLEQALYKLAGTTDFNVALQNGNVNALHRMMKDPTFDAIIRAETGMMVDVNNPEQSAAEQYTDWVNSGRLDVRHLLFRDGRLPIESLPVDTSQGYGLPVQPAMPVNLPNMATSKPQQLG